MRRAQSSGLSLKTLCEGIPGLRLVGDGATVVDRVTIDSRRARHGALFCACRGATATSKDGHAFIPQAISQGASAILLEDEAAVPAGIGVPRVVTKDARHAAAVLAERVNGSPSSALSCVGVTGTNGKTTTTWLLAQLATRAGRNTAVFGTLGTGAVTAPKPLGFTTPEAEVLSEELASLLEGGFRAVAMEVSSHALATARVDGVRFSVGAFTNLSRDHLDFHQSMEAYFEAKSRLFHLLPPHAPAVLPADDDAAGFHARLRALRPDALTWGTSSRARLRAVDVQLGAGSITGALVFDGQRVAFRSPLIGGYNLENLLVATGCALALGIPLDEVAAALETAAPPPGRLQRVDGPAAGALAVVDYAHTPDALERGLQTLRKVSSGRLFVVFGCGGDRDPGKRPIMGRIAAELADGVILTDDNPRSEDGDRILDAIEEGVRAAQAAGSTAHTRVEPAAFGVGTYARLRSRRAAIRTALAAAEPADVVLIAGKGHESGQTSGGVTVPFVDADEVAAALAGRSRPAILHVDAVRTALSARNLEVRGALPALYVGAETNSRTVEPGALFVALLGENHDAHDFVGAALGAGRAGAAVVSHARAAGFAADAPLFIVDDTLAALQDLARHHLRGLPGRRIALTGSNGKTTTKELITAVLRACYGAALVQATEGNLNNHIGVPLTALRCEADHRALVFEMGMNHLGEIALLADIVRPEVGLITNIGTAHAGNVGGIEGVARAKAELFEALGKDAIAVVNADDPRCVREAQKKAKCRHVSFGRAPWADVRLANVEARETGGQELEIVCAGVTVTTSIPLDGRHNADNATGALAVAHALGLPFQTAARGLSHVHRVHGRLERSRLQNGAVLLDDTYNANPDSMEAAFNALVDLAGTRRRVVVLGEMRELGTLAEQAHRHIGAAAAQAGAQLLFGCGEVGRFYGAGASGAGLPASAFIWAQDSAALAPLVAAEVAPGDCVLVKGSRGARMEVVVDALKRSKG